MDRRFVPLSISAPKFRIAAFIWASKPSDRQSNCFPWFIWGTIPAVPFVADVPVGPWVHHGAMSLLCSPEFLRPRVVLKVRQL